MTPLLWPTLTPTNYTACSSTDPRPSPSSTIPLQLPTMLPTPFLSDLLHHILHLFNTICQQHDTISHPPLLNSHYPCLLLLFPQPNSTSCLSPFSNINITLHFPAISHHSHQLYHHFTLLPCSLHYSKHQHYLHLSKLISLSPESQHDRASTLKSDFFCLFWFLFWDTTESWEFVLRLCESSRKIWNLFFGFRNWNQNLVYRIDRRLEGEDFILFWSYFLCWFEEPCLIRLWKSFFGKLVIWVSNWSVWAGFSNFWAEFVFFGLTCAYFSVWILVLTFVLNSKKTIKKEKKREKELYISCSVFYFRWQVVVKGEFLATKIVLLVRLLKNKNIVA